MIINIFGEHCNCCVGIIVAPDNNLDDILKTNNLTIDEILTLKNFLPGFISQSGLTDEVRLFLKEKIILIDKEPEIDEIESIFKDKNIQLIIHESTFLIDEAANYIHEDDCYNEDDCDNDEYNDDEYDEQEYEHDEEYSKEEIARNKYLDECANWCENEYGDDADAAYWNTH